MRKSEDFAAWYPEAIVAGEFISYYDVSGAPPPGARALVVPCLRDTAAVTGEPERTAVNQGPAPGLQRQGYLMRKPHQGVWWLWRALHTPV